MAIVMLDGTVMINWQAVEAQRDTPNAQLMLAVRDGTWKPLGG